MPSKKNNARTKGRAATTAKLGNSERNTANAKSNAPAGTKQQNNPKANSMASAKTKHQSHQPSGGQTQHRNPAPANAWARRNPKVFAAPVAKPHSKASGTGSPPPWKSIFGSAWFWAPKCDPAELERELKTRGFRPASVESVVDSRSAYTLMFNDTDYQDKVLQMAKSRSKRRNTNALHHWFCKVTNIEFARQSFTGLPPLNKTSPASLQNAIINMLNQAIRDDTTEKLHQVEVYSGHDDSESFRQVFFIGNPKFRHRAKPGESPPQLYMEKAGGDRVLLYCSASGSGKTAELAASAYSRDAAFSIQLDVPKDISTPESGPVRRKQARISLKTAIRKLVDEDKGIRALFLEIAQMIKHHGTNENKVRIVVAIDEAGSRPNLVNEIIRHYESHGQDLAAFIMTGCNNPDESGNRLNEKEWKKTQKKSLRVVFSIAGTGLHGDMEGSLPNNFEQLQPIAQRKVEDVYKVLCREYPDSQNKCPPFEQLPEYPLLNDIVHHNSRMTSALVFQLATTNFSYGDPRHQVKVVTAVFVDFCKSNGLEPLWNLPHVRLQAAASAYAALLFQETITVYRHDTPHEIREKALTGAIHFQKFGTHNAKIRDLIGRYGLLTTRSFADLSMEEEQEGGGVEVYPFLMDPAMQRLCGWMIAGGEVMAHADEALGTTSFAYEALTVQFLSSVIAAATTVKAEDRKDLKSMLEDGTAMYASEVRDDGGTFKSLFVDKNIEDSWEGLDGWYPVAFPSEFAMKGMYLQKSPMDLSSDETEPQQQQQQQQQVQQQQPQGQQQQPQGQQQQNQSDWDDVKGWEVELNDCTPFININGLTKYTPPQKSDQETLNIDKEYLKGLWDLRHAINKTPTLEEPTKVFYPPIASVAEGNSNLADGYVSVVVAQKEEVSNKIVWKNLKLVTICIQAKDISTGRKVSNKDIRQNKNRVLHKLLHIPFGEDRVYCVASRPGSLVNRTMSQADADAAKMSTTTGAGDRAAAKALENKHDEMKAAFMRRVEQVIPNNMWGVGSKTRANLLARVAAGIDTDLIAIKEEARNAAITQAEADEAHLASYIAMPIGEIPASKVLADAGILRSEHGKTERFSIQLTYSLT